MKKTALKEYLEILIDLEKNILIQNNAIRQLQVHIEDLKKVNNYAKPVEPKKKDKSMFFIPLIPLVLGILLTIWGISLLGSNTTAFGGVIGSFLGGLVVMGCAAGALISGAVLLINEIQESAAARSVFESAEKAYASALITYERNIEHERIRQEENKIKIAAYEHELELLLEGNRKSKEVLAQIYEPDIVYVTYRNLPLLPTLQRGRQRSCVI